MNISNKIGSLLKHLHSKKRIDPMRDWLALLVCAVMTLAGIIVWNAWAFDTVANGGVIGSSATSTPSVFDDSSLDAIRKTFSTRAEEEVKYRTGIYRYADPSQ